MYIKNNFSPSVVVLWDVTELPKPGFLMSFAMSGGIRNSHTGLVNTAMGTSIPFCLICIFQVRSLILRLFSASNDIGYLCGWSAEPLA